MKNPRKTKFRTFSGALALAGLLGTGLGFSGPGFAQQAPKSDKKVMIKKLDKDGNVTVVEGEDFAHAIRKCPEASNLVSEVTSGADTQKHRTRVTICSPDGKAPTPEMREKLVAALEKAMKETGGLTDMSPERRAEALQALQRELDRVRSEGKN